MSRKSVWTDEHGRPADLTLELDVNLRKLGYYMAQVAPVKSGRLRASLRDPASYSYNKRLKAIRIMTDVPYAKIQDTGGRIPARYPVKAKAMRWWDSGVLVFCKRAKGYYMQGQGYLENGFNLWLSAQPSDNVRIYWGRRRRS